MFARRRGAPGAATACPVSTTSHAGRHAWRGRTPFWFLDREVSLGIFPRRHKRRPGPATSSEIALVRARHAHDFGVMLNALATRLAKIGAGCRMPCVVFVALCLLRCACCLLRVALLSIHFCVVCRVPRCACPALLIPQFPSGTGFRPAVPFKNSSSGRALEHPFRAHPGGLRPVS